MTPQKEKLTHEIRFESLGAMLAYDKQPISNGWRDCVSRSGDKKFTGTDSWEQALGFARDGWPEGRAKMLKTVASAQTAGAIGVAPAFEMDVGGAYPVVALAAAGEPANMVNFMPISERARPIVRLGISGVCSGVYPAESIFNYGAALLAYVDALESADFQCEITWYYLAGSLSGSNNRLHISTILKQAGETLDLDRMAFGLANPSMLRRVGFMVAERNWDSKHQDGYGMPREPVRGLDFDEGMIVLPSVQMFQINDPVLKSPHKILAKVAPTIDALLRDRYADFPPLRFDGIGDTGAQP